MRRIIPITTLALSLVSLADASSSCPLTLVGGTADSDGISVTLRNAGKLPIRRMEFNCTPTHARTKAPQRTPCREDNALFYPGSEYTVTYPYPDGKRQAVTFSLRSITLSNGFVWNPSRRQPCRTLRIYPPRAKK